MLETWTPSSPSDETLNALRIVNLVRTDRAVTRPDIMRVSGLGRSVVAQRVDRAIELGFLEELEAVSTRSGRAPRRLRFRSERGLLLTCALGSLHIHVGLATLDGAILAHEHRDWDITGGPELTLSTAMSMMDALLAGVDTPVWAVAVAVPGPVRFRTGRALSSSLMPGWNGFDIRGRFQEHFDAPTWVDRDANMLALGERVRQPGAHVDLLYCKVGTGISAGMLSDGRVHRGAGGAAGDIGHARAVVDPIPCRCGNVGCLDAVASGWAIVRDAERAINDGAQGLLVNRVRSGAPLTPELVALAADDGDALATTLTQRSAHHVGTMIATLVSAFNPSLIIFGGVVAGAGHVFLAGVRRRVYELCKTMATHDLEIVRSADDAREPLRGGNELLQEQLFTSTFARWFNEGRPTIDTCSAPETEESARL